MTTVTDLWTALEADVDEVQAVTDAQEALSAAALVASAADAALVAAQAAETAANDVLTAAQAADPYVAQDEVDAQAVVDAAVADTATKTTDEATAAVAVVTASDAVTTAEAGVDTAAAQAIADTLKFDQFNMISNAQARILLAGQGKPVLFEEPEDVKSDYWMQPIP